MVDSPAFYDQNNALLIFMQLFYFNWKSSLSSVDCFWNKVLHSWIVFLKGGPVYHLSSVQLLKNYVGDHSLCNIYIYTSDVQWNPGRRKENTLAFALPPPWNSLSAVHTLSSPPQKLKSSISKTVSSLFLCCCFLKRREAALPNASPELALEDTLETSASAEYGGTSCGCWGSPVNSVRPSTTILAVSSFPG